MFLDETSRSVVVHLDSSELIDEVLDLVVELILIIGDFLETLKLRMLNLSLELFDVEIQLVPLSLHDDLLFEEGLVLLVYHLALSLHVFYRL